MLISDIIAWQKELLQLTSYCQTIGCKSPGGCHSFDKKLTI